MTEKLAQEMRAAAVSDIAYYSLFTICAFSIFYFLTAPIGLKLCDPEWPSFYKPIFWIWKPFRPLCEWYFNDVWGIGFFPNW